MPPVSLSCVCHLGKCNRQIQQKNKSSINTVPRSHHNPYIFLTCVITRYYYNRLAALSFYTMLYRYLKDQGKGNNFVAKVRITEEEARLSGVLWERQKLQDWRHTICVGSRLKGGSILQAKSCNVSGERKTILFFHQ